MTDELRHFLIAIAELAGESGEASEEAVRHRCGEGYGLLWQTATELRYLKPAPAHNMLALTTMGRFAAGALG